MDMTSSPRRQVLVQLNESLLAQVDELAARTERNRSDLVREALRELLKKHRAADIDRRYVEAYTKHPDDDELYDDENFLEGADALDAWDGGW